MLRLITRLVGMTALGGLVTACGSSNAITSIPVPTSPSSVASAINLAGTWSGTLSRSNSSIPLQMTVTQDGNTISGSIVTTGQGPDGSPVTFRGTISGTISGTSLTATVT